MIGIESIKNLTKSVYLHEPGERCIIRDFVLDFMKHHKTSVDVRDYDLGTAITITVLKDGKATTENLEVCIRPRYFDKKIQTGPYTCVYVKAYCGQEVEMWGNITNGHSVTWDERVEEVQ